MIEPKSLVQAVDAVLPPEFRRTGRQWTHLSSDVAVVYELQRSPSGHRFYVNLLFHMLVSGKPLPPTRDMDAHYRESSFWKGGVPDLELETLDSVKLEQEVKPWIANTVKPFLLQHASLQGMRTIATTYHGLYMPNISSRLGVQPR